MQDQLFPLDSIADELFVDREHELEFFWKWATDIPKKNRSSLCLICRVSPSRGADY